MKILDNAIEKGQLKMDTWSHRFYYQGTEKVLKTKIEEDEKTMAVLPKVLFHSIYHGKRSIDKFFFNDLEDVTNTYKVTDAEFNDTKSLPDTKSPMTKMILKVIFFLSFSFNQKPSFGAVFELLVPLLIGESFSYPMYNPLTDEDDYEYDYNLDYYDFERYSFSELEFQIHKQLAISEFEDLSLYEIPAILNPSSGLSDISQDRDPDQLYPHSLLTHTTKNNFTEFWHDELNINYFLSNVSYEIYFGSILKRDLKQLMQIMLHAIKGDSRQLKSSAHGE